jgi:hypothetical protein
MTVSLLGVAAAPQRDAATQGDEQRQAVRDVILGAIHHRPPRGGALDPSIQSWLDAHRDALDSVRPSGLGEQPWGLSAVRPGLEGNPPLMFLYVLDWHASGRLVVYGLTGGFKRAYLFTDADENELTTTRQGASTVIDVPKDPPDPLASVVVLELQGKLQTEPLVILPADDGHIDLHGRDAIVHGRMVRYEPDPQKNTVGYWTDPRDWVSWPFEVKQPGTYAVDILQGCGKGSGGSTVEFSVGPNQVLKVTVEDTGGFQNFVKRRIGEFKLEKADRYTLTVKPVNKPGQAVMDLRQVTLTPVPTAPAEK